MARRNRRSKIKIEEIEDRRNELGTYIIIIGFKGSGRK